MNDAVQVIDGPCPGEIERAEAAILRMPQVDCPVVHRFAPGMYWRETTMPAGSVVIGHEHTTEHLNVCLRGRAIVLVDGVRHEISAPFVTTSKAGVRKVALILEEMTWATVHPTTETDVAKLEESLIRKSQAFLENAAREARQLAGETQNVKEIES